MDKVVKVLTANIAHGLHFGEFATVDETRLQLLASELNADVVCLQEIDYLKQRSSYIDQVEVLKQHSNFVASHFFPALVGEPGIRGGFRMPNVNELKHIPPDSYGIGILSRHPIVAVETLQLSGSRFSLPMPFSIDGRTRWRAIPDEPRIVAKVTLDSPLGLVDIITTHLSFIPSRAITQLMALKRFSGKNPTIVAGDLNLTPALTRRMTQFHSAVSALTYPKPKPRTQLDHILLSRQLKSIDSGTLELSASDHLALYAEVTRS